MKIKEILTDRLGFDWAILYTVLGRCLQVSTSVITVLFIVKYLTPNEQGYYYTFGSLVAVQVFFELGLTGIITQFVAHESANLNISGINISGDIINKSRLASILQICVKWYSIISILLLFLLVLVGYIFFNYYSESTNTIKWEGPWIILSIGTVLNFIVSPVTAFIEGLDKVKEVAVFRLYQQIAQPIVLWSALASDMGLYAAGIESVLRVLLLVILIYISPVFETLCSIYKVTITSKVSYINEIFPLQWRIAISWISGYFIFQLFNPVLFATEGSVIAGQMGLSLQALNALQALALAWISTKTPLISILIAQKKYQELDSVFDKTVKQILCIGGFVIVIFVLVIALLQHYELCIFGLSLGDRFLPLWPLVLMSWSTFTMFPINCWATYLRCHKKEPLMLTSVTVGFLSLLSTVGLGYTYGLYGVCMGFAFLRLVSLTWICIIFKRKKYEWHK